MTTALLLHCNGADAATTFTDSSQFPGKSVTAYGDAQLDTADKQFGTASGVFDGTTDYIRTAASTGLAAGANWTFECFVRINSVVAPHGVFNLGTTDSDTNRFSCWIGTDRKVYIHMDVGGTYNWINTTATVSLGIWTHLAVVKHGTNVYIYIGGSRFANFNSTLTTTPTNNTVTVGRARAASGGGQYYFSGNIDEVRYTNDAALYTASSLTVPTAEFTDPVEVFYESPLAYTELTVVDAGVGTPMAYTSLTVSSPVGIPAASTRLVVTAYGTPIAYTALAVVDTGKPASWTVRCIIDGVDVSARIKGVATVEAAEGGARIASVTLRPVSGAVNPLDYVGREITLDFVRRISGTEVPLRVFTGRIDTPEYDLADAVLRLSCVDDLQNRVAALTREQIDLLCGGKYSAAVQGEILDNWDYAQARLSTVAASLDADANGALRVTPWDWLDLFATYGGGDILYRTSILRLPQRSSMVNSVEIAYTYRYPRLRQRYAVVGFSATRIDMHRQGYTYPTQQEIEAACSGSGWVQTRGIFYPAPTLIPHPTGGSVRPRAGAIDMAIIHLTQRHGQSVSETYTIDVSAPESVEQNGRLPATLTGAGQSEFDYQVWEDDLGMAPLLPSGGEIDHAPDFTRADSDYAIETLLDQARVKILASHRGADVSNAVPCDPRIDLDKRIRILDDDMDAAGKVRRVVHVMDMETGSATTEFSIAIFGAGGAGLITPDTLSAPAAPDPQNDTQSWPSEIPPLFVSVYGGTPYSENLMGLLMNPEHFYTVEDVPDGLGGYATESYENPYWEDGSYPETGFRIRMPGVDDADRNPVDKQAESSYAIIIPADPFSFTAP